MPKAAKQKSKSSSSKQPKSNANLLIIGTSLTTLLLTYAVWCCYDYARSTGADWSQPETVATPKPTPQHRAVPLPNPLSALIQTRPGDATTSGPDMPKTEFSAAFSRLHRALRQHHAATAEEVLKMAGSKACPVTWNQGEPALLYDGSTPAQSLSGALNQCADAVEKLPPTASPAS